MYSSVSIVICYRLDVRGSISVNSRKFPLCHQFKIYHDVKLASCEVRAEGAIPSGKTAGALNSPLISVSYRC
jgi:hypothetical protein